MLAVQLGFACAPRARATACATARASHAQRACASLSAPHRSRVGASAAAHRASATLHHPLRRVGAAIRPADPVARTSGRIIGIARRAVDSDAADGALSNGDGVAATDDGDAPAAWLADDDDAEVCAASFEVTEAALHSLCHGNAPPPACTHEYWRARGWKARPRDWERWAGTAWASKDAWPAHCVADDDGVDAAAAAGSERARAAHAHAQAEGAQSS